MNYQFIDPGHRFKASGLLNSLETFTSYVNYKYVTIHSFSCYASTKHSTKYGLSEKISKYLTLGNFSGSPGCRGMSFWSLWKP